MTAPCSSRPCHSAVRPLVAAGVERAGQRVDAVGLAPGPRVRQRRGVPVDQVAVVHVPGGGRPGGGPPAVALGRRRRRHRVLLAAGEQRHAARLRRPEVEAFASVCRQCIISVPHIGGSVRASRRPGPAGPPGSSPGCRRRPRCPGRRWCPSARPSWPRASVDGGVPPAAALLQSAGQPGGERHARPALSRLPRSKASRCAAAAPVAATGR